MATSDKSQAPNIKILRQKLKGIRAETSELASRRAALKAQAVEIRSQIDSLKAK